jgi:RNA polymerase sigma-70 factor (ECF subfamily)
LRASEQLTRFEEAILPHDEAAYNLARWLTGNDQDARDVVQEAYLRAYQFFGSFRGGDGRAWLLGIVRRTGYTWLERNRSRRPAMTFDEHKHSSATPAAGPEAPLVQREDVQVLRQALNELAPEYRETIVLRELEGLSYKEIAGVTGVPLGTVMSRLARAREQLQQRLAGRADEGS